MNPQKKQLIVERVERKLSKWIVDPKQCNGSCKCDKCFQTALDRLVDTTEVLTNACRTGVSFDYVFPSDELQVRAGADR